MKKYFCIFLLISTFIFSLQSEEFVRLIKTDNIATTETIINKSTELNGDCNIENSLMYHSIEKNDFDTIKKLVEKGFEIDSLNYDGDTPLMIATMNNNYEIVKLLIEKGARIEAFNNTGYTALMFAAMNNNYEIAKLLIEKGADIEKTNIYFQTPLIITTIQNSYDVKKLLIETSARQDDIKIESSKLKKTELKGISAIASNNGNVIWKKFVKPEYPEEAGKNAWIGTVEVEFLVKNNKTIFLGITQKSGYSVFDRAVEKVVRNWVILIKKNEIFVDGKVSVRVNFEF